MDKKRNTSAVSHAAPGHRRTQQSISLSQEISYTSSVLPSAKELAALENMCDGATDRFISIFESQVNHRQTLEIKRLDGDIQSERRGQYIAGAIFLAVIGAGVYLTALGLPVLGLCAVIGAMVVVVGIFILGRKGGAKELLEKRGKLNKQVAEQEREGNKQLQE